MSTTFEKISAQAAAFTASGVKDHGRHLIGPVELGALFDEVDRLLERIRRLEEAGDAMADADDHNIKELWAAWTLAKEAKP